MRHTFVDCVKVRSLQLIDRVSAFEGPMSKLHSGIYEQLLTLRIADDAAIPNPQSPIPNSKFQPQLISGELVKCRGSRFEI
jgi:hypothetical protein